MLTSFWLTAALVVAASPEAVEWPTVHVEPGREILWTGSARETLVRSGSTVRREFRLEVRLLGMHSIDGIHTVAIQTVWKPTDELADARGGRLATLELAELHANGQLRRLAVRADGKTQRDRFDPPTPDRLPECECGLFVECPAELPPLGGSWTRTETDRPDSVLTLADYEPIRSALALKVSSVRKQTAGNDRWERRETAWVSALKGHVVRLERDIVMHTVTQSETEYRLETELEMVREVQLGANSETFRERRSEIERVMLLRAAFEAVVAESNETSPRRFDAVLARMERYRAATPASQSLPWRDSLEGLIRRTEAASRGLAPVHVASFAPVSSAAIPLATGTTLPPFRAKDVAGRFEVDSAKFRGQLVALCWYRPAERSTPDLLARLQGLKRDLPKGAELFGLAFGSEIASWRQGSELGVGFPILGSADLHDRFRVGNAPRLVLIDTDGVVRESLEATAENVDKVRKRLRELTR